MGERELSREFGYRVMRRRMALGMNQKTLAERTGVRQGLVSRLEKGENVSMKFEKLVLLAEVLSTSVDYLLARTDDAGEIPDMPRCAVVG